MNDEQLLERLERATAPGKLTPADLDAETAELRGSWLALGDLLARADAEVAGRSFPEREFAETVALARGSDLSATAQGRINRMWFAGVLASSLLLVIAVTVWWQSQATIQPPGPGIVNAPAQPKIETPVVPTPEAPGAEEFASDDDWLGDELDEQIAAAGSAVVTVEQDWFARSAPARVLSDRMDRVEKTWDEDSL